jgi:transposase
MAVAYSKEFRREVLAACDSGKGTQEVALAFGVSESWVRRIKQVRRECGQTAPKQTRDRKPDWWVYKDRIIAVVAATPDISLSELQAALGTTLSRSTLCVALNQLNLTFKKKSSKQPNSTDAT